MKARPRPGGRRWILVGVVIAALGVPLFFGSTYRGNLAGLGLIVFGAGIAWLTLIAVTIRAERAYARESHASAVALRTVLTAALVFPAFLSLGLIAFGALCLLLAIGGG